MTLTSAHRTALERLSVGEASNLEIGRLIKKHMKHPPTSRTKTIFLAQRLMKSLEEIGLASFSVGKGRTYLWRITDAGRARLP